MIVLVAAFAGTLWIRGSLAVLLVVSFVVGIILALKRVPIVLLGGMIGVAAIGGSLVARAGAMTGAVSIQQINLSRGELSSSGSGFGTVAYDGPLSLVRSLPSLFARALLGPFPWEFSSLPSSALIDLAAWYLLLLLGWRGLKVERSRSLMVCVVPALCLLVVLAATSGNYGTMVRLRVGSAILLIPLAAMGWPRKSSSRIIGVPSMTGVERLRG